MGWLWEGGDWEKVILRKSDFEIDVTVFCGLNVPAHPPLPTRFWEKLFEKGWFLERVIFRKGDCGLFWKREIVKNWQREIGKARDWEKSFFIFMLYILWPEISGIM
jgi:hypothetical protein